jgi:hypothetical protein
MVRYDYTISASLSYKTLWGHAVSEPFKTLGSLTIDKVPTSITVEPSQASVGESVIVKGSITLAMSTTITLTVKEPDGTTKTLNTTSSPDGEFGYTLILDKEGKYSFAASLQGDNEHEASTSQPSPR